MRKKGMSKKKRDDDCTKSESPVVVFNVLRVLKVLCTSKFLNYKENLVERWKDMG